MKKSVKLVKKSVALVKKVVVEKPQNQPPVLTFTIIDSQYDDALQEYRSVQLNGKEIFRLKQERIMGVMRNQTKEVLAALKKETGIDWTRDELQRAMLFGTLTHIK
jgi:hypothetical protein